MFPVIFFDEFDMILSEAKTIVMVDFILSLY